MVAWVKSGGGAQRFAEFAEGESSGAELAHGELETGFDRAERDARVGGDLALGHAPEISELHGLLLRFGEIPDEAGDDGGGVILRGFLVGSAVHGAGGFGFAFQAEAILRAPVGGFAAEAVDGAAAGERHDPAERFSLFGIVIFRATPDFEQAFLHEFIHIVFIGNDAVENRAQQRVVTPMEQSEGALVAALDVFHELFVREVVRRNLRTGFKTLMIE